MPNPAFIVEGQMEQKIVRRLCPGQPAIRIGCNGEDVHINRMCDFVETHIRTFGNRYYPIFVVFDREGRTETAAEIQQSVTADLNGRGLEDQDIRVFVADRQTEDWYLRDLESIRDHYGLGPHVPQNFQGKSGLKQYLNPKVAYHETTIGVDIFFIVSWTKIREACDQFAGLFQAAEEIHCESVQRLV